jgi:CheY-like chemotaxis protein
LPFRIPEGLRAAQEERPAVIFLDLTMPGLGGHAVIDGLRAHPTTRDIPVVVYTSMSLEDGERQAILAKTVAILPKETLARSGATQAVRDVLERTRIAPVNERQR